MTMRTRDELIHMVQNGASLDIQTGNLRLDDLKHIARNLPENASLTLRGVDKRFSVDELVQIKRSTVGTVTFVLD